MINYKVALFYMKWYHKTFLILKLIFIVIYLLTKFKILFNEPEIEYLVEDTIKIMVTIFCLYIFWPFRSKYQIKKHDRYFGFSAGIFLLISLKALSPYNYLHNLYNYFRYINTRFMNMLLN